MKNRSLKTLAGLLAATALATCLGHQLRADDFQQVDSGARVAQHRPLQWRPGHFGGRSPDRSQRLLLRPFLGGLWKTEDAGTYWIPVGDGQFRYASVGAIALHEKNPDIMYVGLGEPQMRQSVSWGDGMYKTTDGGKTWTHLGLEEARQISKVIIHPDDPNRVYVASMGHTWGPSPERGVFRTTDGGKTWDKVLFKSDKTGCIDMVMSPENPNILFAALWEFERKAWGAKTAGPEGGLWKSTDGGDTWQEITRNEGLPEGMWGRLGLDMSAADPKRVYALIDNETRQGLYRSDDLGETWRFVSDDANITARPFYFYHLHADPSNADNLWVPGNKLWRSTDAGKTWILEPGIKDDFQDIWIDPQGRQPHDRDLRRRHAGHSDRRQDMVVRSPIRAACSSIAWIPMTSFPTGFTGTPRTFWSTASRAPHAGAVSRCT